MANETESNGTSDSDKASGPSPSGDADSMKKEASESPPPQPEESTPPPPPEKSSPPPPEKSSPPPANESPPPSAEESPPPSPTHSPPPTPSHSPPPAPLPSSPPPSPSPPLPPPPSQSPPPPSHSPPPPSKSSPPPQSPSSPSPSPPPPVSSSPPTLPPSPQPPSSPDSPPPPSLSPPIPVPKPSPPTSNVTPSPPPPLAPNGPAPSGPAPSHHPPPAPHSKPNDPPPPKSESRSTPSSSGNNVGEYIGFTIMGVFILALVAGVLFCVIKKKKKRENTYVIPPQKISQMKGGGGDVHYYVEESGFGNGPQDGYYNSSGGQHIRTPSDNGQHMSTGQIVFTYDKILEITNGFSRENIIGEGGFGYVYKASMPDGRVGAVKMLKAGSGQGEREFRAEVDIISRVHHRHLVSLIGYCLSEQQRVLIYEFVPNGNLNQHLHGTGGQVLDWNKRMKIAIGAAKGLAYLHEGCNPRIIHRDIKSANILLDDAYEAQVADFGLARLTDDANTHVSTRVMGTFGYMAPEYATSGKLTDRSDVFSYGVVLLELITGRKPVDPTQPVGDESLVEWARPLLVRAVETGDFGELVDPRLEGQYIDSEMFRMIEAAAACVRHSAPKRPRMVQVVRAFDSGDQLYDLSNGVKYGQSTVYDSGQYNEDIIRFRRMAHGSFDDSEFDTYGTDYRTREMSGSKHSRMPYSTSGESEFGTDYSQTRNMY